MISNEKMISVFWNYAPWNLCMHYLEKMKAGWNNLDNINYIESIEEYKQIVVNNVEQFKKQASVPPTNTENQESLEALGDD